MALDVPPDSDGDGRTEASMSDVEGETDESDMDGVYLGDSDMD